MNAHLFLFGPTGSGKSATLNNLLNQVTAIYRPRLFIVEAGNSFGLFTDFAKRLGLTVHRVKLSPGAGISLAPFADARRLIETPSDVQTLRSEEHTSELQSLMRISYAVFCLKTKTKILQRPLNSFKQTRRK